MQKPASHRYARLDQTTCVNPKLVVNRPIEDMSPHLDREELKNIMIIDVVKEAANISPPPAKQACGQPSTG
ncbi:MAG: hypothetical protein K6T66_06190 [Peptococcaceae bacterium]|nr:hypothetical protein [Peptococcaceae bacterium]